MKDDLKYQIIKKYMINDYSEYNNVSIEKSESKWNAFEQNEDFEVFMIIMGKCMEEYLVRYTNEVMKNNN